MNISKGYKKTTLDNHFQAFLQTKNLPIAIPEVINIARAPARAIAKSKFLQCEF